MVSREQIKSLLRGSIDLHLHASPDRFARRQSLREVARDAAESGMLAIVVKNQDTLSSTLGSLVEEIVPGVKIFGGLVLNRAVGGFNPYAVEIAAKLGAKVIWMPSIDSAWTIEKFKRDPDKVSIYGSRVNKADSFNGLTIYEEGLQGTSVRREVIEIVEIIVANNLVLDTSHLSPQETMSLINLSKKMGAKRIMCSHINNPVIGATIPLMKRYAEEGVYLSYSLTPCMPGRAGQQPAEIAKMIREVGIDYATIGTDFGKEDNPPPVEGMYMTIAHLLANGFNETEIRRISKHNPALLLGLEVD